MLPDPVLIANTKQWLLRAEEDLSNAEHDLLATPPFVRSALFHCQQAAEKALKGFLTWHDRVFRRTHNLEELGELCIRIEPGLAAVVQMAVPLTENAAKFRYPDAPYQPSLEEAGASIATARDLLNCVLAKLPAEFSSPQVTSET